MLEQKFGAIKTVSILEERVRKKIEETSLLSDALSFFLHVYVIKIIYNHCSSSRRSSQTNA